MPVTAAMMPVRNAAALALASLVNRGLLVYADQGDQGDLLQPGPDSLDVRHTPNLLSVDTAIVVLCPLSSGSTSP